MTSDDWPYERDGVPRDGLATELRLPIIGSPHPSRYYITAIVVSDLYRGVMPTDDEIRMAASYHDEYVTHWYTDYWRARMRERPFDIDSGANGRYLIKHRDRGWGYRLATWRDGPLFVHSDPSSGLVATLDRSHRLAAERVSARWEAWKTAHPDVFGKAVSA